jgi:glycosyltransferase involved in cell wall biosynthesis
MSGRTIWIINQYAGSPGHGMEMRHYYLAKELVKNGNKVCIISGSYSHLYRVQPDVSGNYTFENIDGIDYCWVKVPAYKRSVSAARIFNMLRFMFMLRNLPVRDIAKPDAIVVSSPSLFPIVRAKKWAKKLNARLLFEVRDIWPLTLQELGSLSSSHPLVRFMQWFEIYAYRNADKVISLLPNAKEHMMAHGMREDKFIVIPNGIDEAVGNDPLPAAITDMLPANKFIAGYAGTWGVANSLDTFVKAAQLLKEDSSIHFVLVGGGDMEQQLKEMARDMDNITFIPAIKKTQVQAMLSRFDVCYIGLKRESLFRFGVSPNKLFDYMYAAKPIVYAIDSGNMPVDEAQCGISVTAEAPAAVARAVKQLAGLSNEEREKMGANGRAYILKNHTYELLAKRLFNSANE